MYNHVYHFFPDNELSNSSRSGNSFTDKVVIIVDESESDKVEDQMVSEGQVSSSDDDMGRASENVSDNVETGAILHGRRDGMVGGAVVGESDAMGEASESGVAIEGGGDVVVGVAVLSDDTMKKATEIENGGTVSSTAEGEPNNIVDGTRERKTSGGEGKF